MEDTTDLLLHFVSEAMRESEELQAATLAQNEAEEEERRRALWELFPDSDTFEMPTSTYSLNSTPHSSPQRPSPQRRVTFNLPPSPSLSLEFSLPSLTSSPSPAPAPAPASASASALAREEEAPKQIVHSFVHRIASIMPMSLSLEHYDVDSYIPFNVDYGMVVMPSMPMPMCM
jgi:hypothetical protein